VDTVFAAWVDRTRDLNAMPEVEQVFVFENRGEEIGVTLSHPHGQIYAYPFVPPRMRRQIESARRYGDRRRERPGHRRGAARRPVAVRGARLPAPARARPAGAHRRRARRGGQGLPGPAAAVRPPVPDADAVHRGLDAGARPRRPRADAPARGGVLDPPRRRQAQVPRRQRVRSRGLDQRHQPGGGGRGAARRDPVDATGAARRSGPPLSRWCGTQKSMSPAPGRLPAAGEVFSGLSATTASVVRNSPAIEAAFCRAARTTLVGSGMPASSMFTYSPVAALRPCPVSRLRTFSATTPPSRPALTAICFSGASSAMRTMFAPVASSPSRSSFSNAVLAAWASATPPPATMPSS